jgi:Zn-dependent M28 family amino/carboxypeptidase
VINKLATAAGIYTGLTVQTSLTPFASDHVPFINAGLPAVLAIEGADSANDETHSTNAAILSMRMILTQLSDFKSPECLEPAFYRSRN